MTPPAPPAAAATPGSAGPWTWRLQAGDGATTTAATAPPHGNQSDAESWLGEHWHELADAGVAQVSLFDGDRKVYGPMPLAAD